MKKLACVIIAAVVGFAATVPASAQLKFGLKAGVAVNNLKFDKDIVKSTTAPDSRAVPCLNSRFLLSELDLTLR